MKCKIWEKSGTEEKRSYIVNKHTQWFNDKGPTSYIQVIMFSYDDANDMHLHV